MDVIQTKFEILATDAVNVLSNLSKRASNVEVSFDSAGKATISFNSTLQVAKNTLNKFSSEIESANKSSEEFRTKLSRIDKTITSLVSNIKKQQSALNSNNIAMKNLTQAIKEQSQKIDDLVSGMNEQIAKSKSVETQNKKTANSFKTLLDSISNTNKKSFSLFSTLAKISLLAYTARQVGYFFSDGVEKANTYIESLNLFTVALGDNAKRAMVFIDQMSSSFGLDEAYMTKTLGLFYQISESLGLASEKSYILAENFTKLAYDLSSLYDINYDEAVTKLMAGLVGETEPLRRLGIIITENNLAETARQLGITKSIRNMTEAEKIQLRYTTALIQTKNAQGDLSRTLEQPANQIRIVKEQLSILSREIGTIFIPVLQEVLPYVSAFVRAIAELIHELNKNNFNIDEYMKEIDTTTVQYAVAMEDTEDASEGIADNLSKALATTKSLNTAMVGIDELNVLSTNNQNNSSWGSISGIMQDVADEIDQIDIPFDSYQNIIGSALDRFDETTKDIKTRILSFVSSFTGVFDDIKTAYETINEKLFGEITYESFIETLHNVLVIIDDIGAGIINAGISIYDNIIKPIKDFFDQNVSNDLFSFFTDKKIDETGKETSNLQELVKLLTEFLIAYKTIGGVAGLLSTTLSNPITVSALTITGGLIYLFGDMKQTGEDLNNILKDSLIAEYGEEAGNNIYEEVKIDTSFLGGFKTVIKDIAEGAKEAKNLLIDGAKFGWGWIIEKIPNVLTNLQENKSKEDEVKENLAYMDVGFTRNILAPLLVANQDSIESGIKTITTTFENAQKSREQTSAISTFLDNIGFGFLKPFAPQLNNIANEKTLSFNFNQSLNKDKTEDVIEKANTSVEVLSKDIKENSAITNQFTSNYGSITERLIESLKEYDNSPKPVLKEAPIPNAVLYQTGQGGYEYDAKQAVDNLLNNVVSAALTIMNNSTTDYNTKTLEKSNEKISKTFLNTDETIGWNAFIGFFEKIKDAFSNAKIVPTTDASAGFLNFMGKVSDFSQQAVRWAKAIAREVEPFFETFIATPLKSIIKTLTPFYNEYQKNVVVYKDDNGIVTGSSFSNLGYEAQSTMTFNAIGSLGSSLFGDTFTIGMQLAEALSNGTITGFLMDLPEFLDVGVLMIKNLANGITQQLPQIIKVLTSPDFYANIINSLIDLTLIIVENIPTIISSLIGAIPNIISAIIDAVFQTNWLAVGWNIIVLIVQGIINGAVDLVSSAINTVTKTISKLWTWIGIPAIPEIQIPHVDFSGVLLSYATGGFPPQGELFIAREAGAEMVGTIGNRTAVVNNDQIVEAVSNGVYQAVSQALSENQSTDKSVNIYLDGKKIYNNQKRIQNRMGMSFGMGGI